MALTPCTRRIREQDIPRTDVENEALRVIRLLSSAYKDGKNEKTGKWEGKYPIINSVIYDNITNLIQKSSLSWESEPEYISIKLE